MLGMLGASALQSDVMLNVTTPHKRKNKKHEELHGRMVKSVCASNLLVYLLIASETLSLSLYIRKMARNSIAHLALFLCGFLFLVTQSSAFLSTESRPTSFSISQGCPNYSNSATQLQIFKKNKPEEVPKIPEKKESAFKLQNFLNPIGNPYILVPYFLIWIYWIDYVKTHP